MKRERSRSGLGKLEKSGPPALRAEAGKLRALLQKKLAPKAR